MSYRRAFWGYLILAAVVLSSGATCRPASGPSPDRLSRGNFVTVSQQVVETMARMALRYVSTLAGRLVEPLDGGLRHGICGGSQSGIEGPRADAGPEMASGERIQEQPEPPGQALDVAHAAGRLAALLARPEVVDAGIRLVTPQQ